jgi:hypothetical protein
MMFAEISCETAHNNAQAVALRARDPTFGFRHPEYELLHVRLRSIYGR